MPTSGSGVGTPISGGAGAASGTYEPLPYTLLCLHRYAKVMGIAPLHFAGAYTPGLSPTVQPVEAACSSLWFRYDWQMFDQVSHYQLVQEIKSCEEEIAKFIGYWPAPMWIESEQHMQTRPYLREYYGTGLNVRSTYKSVKTNFAKIVHTHQRTVDLIGTATTAGGSLVYSDDDGDGFFEAATITLATTVTAGDAQEIKVYFTGHFGVMEWEVRPLKSISIAGGNVTIKLSSWLLIDPDLYEVYPTSDGIDAIDVSTTSNFVGSIEVYHEHGDSTEPAVEFTWEPSNVPCSACSGTGCDACAGFTQDGCVSIRDPLVGLVTPVPATYSESDGQWSSTTWTGTREPDYLRVWYRAGEISAEYLRGVTVDPLSNEWARLIAYMATSRLERPPCACGNQVALHTWLAEDLSRSGREQSFFMPAGILDNPFGTRRGEVMAWRKLAKLAGGRVLNATAI